MKTFSFAAITGALIFTTSLAVAGPRPGPDCRAGHVHFYGGYAGPGIVVRGPSLPVLPRIVLPAPAIVYSPRAAVVAHRRPAAHVRPSPAPAPVVVSTPAPDRPRKGDGKPEKSESSRKPSKPAR